MLSAGIEKSPPQPAEKTVLEDRSIKCQVLSGLELCRQAQIVANEACLRHISQGCEGDAIGLQSAVEVCTDVRIQYRFVLFVFIVNDSGFNLQEAQRNAWVRIKAVAEDQFLHCKNAYEMKAKAVAEEEAKAKQVLKLLRDEEALANQALLIAMQNLEARKRKL